MNPALYIKIIRRRLGIDRVKFFCHVFHTFQFFYSQPYPSFLDFFEIIITFFVNKVNTFFVFYVYFEIIMRYNAFMEVELWISMKGCVF